MIKFFKNIFIHRVQKHLLNLLYIVTDEAKKELTDEQVLNLTAGIMEAANHAESASDFLQKSLIVIDIYFRKDIQERIRQRIKQEFSR